MVFSRVIDRQGRLIHCETCTHRPVPHAINDRPNGRHADRAATAVKRLVDSVIQTVHQQRG
jgi:hypothetical protein